MRTLPFILFAVIATAQQNPQPCDGLPPGRHALLERMTAQLGLTCDQQVKIEPILHEEESVTKPLLKFSSFSKGEEQAAMVTIKLAARRQVRTILTAEQQKGMDDEVDSVKSGKKGGNKSGGKNGGGKTNGKRAAQPASGLDDEVALANAIASYGALTPDEKKTMLLKVKQAARSDDSLHLTAEQHKTLDAEIASLKK